MPKTKLQKAIFALMTVIITVILFTLYNVALLQGEMNNNVFNSFDEMMLIEIIAAFIIQFYFVGPIVEKNVFKLLHKKELHPTLITTIFVCLTVSIMCPSMSFVATILHNGINSEFVSHWLQKIVFNFPFALCTQLFYIQPFVRFMFKLMFDNKNQLATN